MPGANCVRKQPAYSLDLVREVFERGLIGGETIQGVCIEHGVRPSTFYGWTRRHPEARLLADQFRSQHSTKSGKRWTEVIKDSGNPRTVVTAEAMAAILARVRQGDSLAEAAKGYGIDRHAIWQAIHDKGLVNVYEDARRTGSHAMAESTLEILDDDSGDLVEQKDGRLTVNTARVRRDQARASQRMILAARANPEYYGPPQQSRAPQVVINIDGDKLQRIRDVSAATLKQIGSDGDDNS